MRLITSFFTISILLCTCTRTKRFENTSIHTVIKPSVVEQEKNRIKPLGKRIGNTAYYLSLPHDYKIEEVVGSGFHGYIFYYTDTVTKSILRGGVYCGENLNEFEP